jgi:hypothetical protein
MTKFSLLEQIVLILFLSSGLSFFLYQLILRLKIVLTGKSDFTTDQLPDRLKRVFDEVILHKKSCRWGEKICRDNACSCHVWIYFLWTHHNQSFFNGIWIVSF